MLESPTSTFKGARWNRRAIPRMSFVISSLIWLEGSQNLSTGFNNNPVRGGGSLTRQNFNIGFGQEVVSNLAIL